MSARVVIALLLLLAGPVVAGELAVVTVERQMIAVEHQLDGVVEAVNQATVSAQTSGRITELPFDVDDFVEKGEVIVRFRDNEQRARHERAQAALEEARARHGEAESEFQRIRNIFAENLVSKAEMDRAKANLDAARARLAAAEAALREAAEQLEQTVVRAPYSGIVMERHVQIGEVATVGTPLMTGLSLEHLRVVASVPQSLIGHLRRDPAARIQLPNGETADAVSLRVFPYADADTHTFRVRAELPEGQHGVYPGMLVKLAFTGEQRESLLVPADALVRRGEVTAVYVVDPAGRLHFRQVRPGRFMNGMVEVLAGAAEGDTVALDAVAAAVTWKAQPLPAAADESEPGTDP